MKLSVTIAAKNESKNIAHCIEAVHFADEVVVIDDGSEDDTASIAKSLGAVVATIESHGNFHRNKNAAIQMARGDWILSLDADEFVSEELSDAIRSVLSRPRHDGYLIDRHNYFMGRWIRGCGWYPNDLLRLFKKGKAWWPLEIHDVPRLPEGNRHLPVLKGSLIHRSYTSFDDYFDKFNRYTSKLATEYCEQGIRTDQPHTALNLAIRPFYWFMKKYLFLGGYRDGRYGLFISFSSALTILVSHLKYLQLAEKSDANT